MARHSVSYTVSVDGRLLRQFKQVCKERGRSQAYYIGRCMKRVVEGLENAENETPKPKRKARYKQLALPK